VVVCVCVFGGHAKKSYVEKNGSDLEDEELKKSWSCAEATRVNRQGVSERKKCLHLPYNKQSL